MRSALEKGRLRRAIALAPRLALEIVFRDHAGACSASFPRAYASFETGGYFEVLKALAFMLRG